jgi:hypothetical protein
VNMNLFLYLLSEFFNRNKSRSSRMMLLDTSDLPGDEWRVQGKRSWRTGVQLKRSNERSLRAYETGSFTAWRDYRQVVPVERSIWIEVIPYASAEDAETEIPLLRSHFVMRNDPRSKVTEERKIDDLPISGVTNTFIYEQITLGRRGPGIARYAAGSVEHIVFLLACFSHGEFWSWSDVTETAAKQANKIRETLRELKV